MLVLARAILYINSADIKSVLKSSVGPKMAENTVQNDLNDNQHGILDEVQLQCSFVFTELSAVMKNLFTNLATPKPAIRHIKGNNYLSKYSLLSALTLTIFWTCQCTFAAISLPTNIYPVISSVNFVGSVNRQHIESTTVGDKAGECFETQKTSDILLQVKGTNLASVSRWKATGNPETCEDDKILGLESDSSPVISIKDHDQIMFMVTVSTESLKYVSSWFLCTKNRANEEIFSPNSEDSALSWVHLGQLSEFHLPFFGKDINAERADLSHGQPDRSEQLERHLAASLATRKSYANTRLNNGMYLIYANIN